MLRSVLIFVSPSSNSFPFVRAISRTVLNFQAATPAVRAFAKRPPQGLLCGDGSGAGANWRQREQRMSGDSAAPQFGHVIDEVVGVTCFHSIGTQWQPGVGMSANAARRSAQCHLVFPDA